MSALAPNLRAIVHAPEMPFMARAIDPAEVRRQFEHNLHGLRQQGGRLYLNSIQVTRYKPGRRCLVEYDVKIERSDAEAVFFTLVGKVRAKGVDTSSYRILQAIWGAGFSANSDDRVCVPEPIGVVPEFHMWLQRKVPGIAATHLLLEPGGTGLAQWIAEAIHKVHRTNVPSQRRHTMADELRILHERLPIVAQSRPHWIRRIQRLLDACDRLGLAIPEAEPRSIHRDFYPDHVLVDGPRLYLLDFDLHCVGDPALDVGNFLGHMTEQALRTLGNPDALADREEALEERFMELAGEATRPSVQAYKTLTLARHVYLSTQLPNRGHCTEPILELCERRLSAGWRSATYVT